MSDCQEANFMTSAMQSSDVDAGQSDRAISGWETLGRLFRHRPGLMGTFCLIALAGISTLLGLSAETAWAWLIIGLVLLAVTVHCWNWFRRTAGTAAGSKARKRIADDILWYVLLGLTFYAGRYSVQKQYYTVESVKFREIAKREQEKQIAAASQTKAYWDNVVASLHQARFGVPTPIQGESLEAFDKRRSEILASALAQARRANSDHVDPELVKMAERHFQTDDQALQLFEHSIQIVKARTTRTTNASAQERIPDLTSFTANLTEDDLVTLPPDIQEMIRDGWKLEETRLEQLREIEIMQARLNERYKSQGWESLGKRDPSLRFELPFIQTID